VRSFLKRLLTCWKGKPEVSPNIRLGRLGEEAARIHLSEQGMRFLTANYRTPRGEIDLVFRDRDCLVFVEVKTRSESTRTRPALAVDIQKRQRISRAAETYLRRIDASRTVWRFDVVEVFLKEEKVSQIQHLKNVFELHPRRPGGRRGSGG
jgi:putative endonuclease